MRDGRSELPEPAEAYRSYLKVLARTRLPPGLDRHLDDSDIVQMTLLEAHRDEEQFQGRTRGEKMAWLRQILARNLADAVKRLKRAKRDIARDKPLESQLGRTAARLEQWCVDPNGATPSGKARSAEQVVALSNAIECLNPDQREAIVLRHLHGISLREIGHLMDRSLPSVAALLHRGLVALHDRAGQIDGA